MSCIKTRLCAIAPIVVTVVLGLVVPMPSFAQTGQALDSISLERIERETSLLQQDPRYALIMNQLRLKVKTEFLSQLYARSLADPNYMIGGVKLSELFQKLDQVNIVENGLGRAIQADPNRATDFYVLGGNIGMMNQEFFQGTDRSPALIMLHVLLGAAGYQDNDYRLTLGLILANLRFQQEQAQRLNPSNVPPFEINVHRLLPTEPRNIYRTNPTDYTYTPRTSTTAPAGIPVTGAARASGGFTGVGGGGDSTSVELKMKMLEGYSFFMRVLPEQCRTRWSTFNDYFDDIAAARIESSETARDFAVTKDQNDVLVIAVSKRAKGVEFTDDTISLGLVFICGLAPNAGWR